ncbi:MAG: divalent-cation tolerance protein CutA [Dehalococcoidia bacterium]
MNETDRLVVFITVSGEEEARKIAGLLVEARKAACVNIVPGVDSVFWWKDELDSAKESLLIVKTKAVLLSEVIELVKGAHSYEVPEIIALPIVAGNQDYLEWLDQECR